VGLQHGLHTQELLPSALLTSVTVHMQEQEGSEDILKAARTQGDGGGCARAPRTAAAILHALQ